MNKVSKNCSLNGILLRRLMIQNNLKLSITEKRKNKAKYLTWNSRWLTFVRKTSMLNPNKSLGYINLSSPRPDKSPSNSIRFNCQICSSSKRSKSILETRKGTNFSGWWTILLFTSFLKTLLTTERRLTEQQFLAADLSPTFSNTEATDETFQKSGKKTTLDTYWKVQLICK